MHTTGTGTTRPAETAAGETTTGAREGAPTHDRDHTYGASHDAGGGAVGWDLDPGPRAASRARALTGDALRSWNVTDSAALDDVVLIVDELVTNAVVHGTGAVRLTLRLDTVPAGEPAGPANGSVGGVEGTRRDARVVGEVADAAPAVPRVPAEPPEVLDWAEAGRGLLLVAALATEFGARPGPSGKTVWFTRHLAPSPGHPNGAARN